MILGSGLGIVLSLVFGCLLLALLGELYYLLWWKSPRLARSTAPASTGQESGKEAGSVEAELLRLQNRLLFTIREETKEDLESEAAKSSRKGSRTRSLSDLIMAGEDDSPGYGGFQGFNPLFEAAKAEEVAVAVAVEGLRGFSPPPKMKFLRDAEEKMRRKEEEELGEGSFVRIVFGKNCGTR